jgi:hypothetical protein
MSRIWISLRSLHLKEEILRSINGMFIPGEVDDLNGWESLFLLIKEEYFVKELYVNAFLSNAKKMTL